MEDVSIAEGLITDPIAQSVSQIVVNCQPPLGDDPITRRTRIHAILNRAGRARPTRLKDINSDIIAELCNNLYHGTPRHRPHSQHERLIAARIRHSLPAGALMADRI